MNAHNASPEKMTHPPLRYALPCIIITLLCVVAMLLSMKGYGPLSSRQLAILASTGFVALSLSVGGYRHAYGRCVIVALIFCWLGDVLGPSNFILGVGMFFLAHLFLIIAFLVQRPQAKRLVVPFCVMFVVSIPLFFWLLPNVPKDQQLPVFAYLVIIVAMVITAAGIAYTPRGRIAFIAAIIFFISDIFVARWKYVTPGFSNALGCYPLYYSACLLFAWSAGPFQQRPAKPAENPQLRSD